VIRLLLLIALLLPGLALAGDDVPSPDGETSDSKGDEDASPADGDVPAPDGAPAPSAPDPLPSAEGGVPGPDGQDGAAADPSFPAEDGATPAPHEASEPFAADEGAAPPPVAPAEPFPSEPGDPPSADQPEAEEEAVPASPLAQPSPALFEEGNKLFAQLQFDAAVVYFEEVLRRDPEDSNARNRLVESLRALEREEDAVAVLEGAVPLGEPTPFAEPEPEEEERSRNPRGDRRFSAGIGLGGSSVGLGAWAEFRPHWIAAISGGFGALVLVQDARTSGIGSGFLGVDFLPLPFYISPVVGVGVAAIFGDAVWRTDSFTKPWVTGTDIRLLPYLNLGARLDLGRMQMQAGVWLVPTGQRSTPLVPVPGARIGLHF
jgi:hypothetical protein